MNETQMSRINFTNSVRVESKTYYGTQTPMGLKHLHQNAQEASEKWL